MTLTIVKRYPVTLDGETLTIGTSGELAIALDVLNGTRDRELLEQLAPHLAEITRDSAGLLLIFKSLSSADQIYFVETVGGQLTTLIGSAPVLRDLLAILAEEAVEEKIVAVLGGAGLSALIHNAQELAGILHWVHDKADKDLLDLLGAEYLRRIIHNGYELSQLLDALHETGERELLEMLGRERLKHLISDGRDLAYIVRALPPQESEYVLNQFTARELIQLIGNADDWAYLWQRLEPAEAELLATKLGVEYNAA